MAILVLVQRTALTIGHQSSTKEMFKNKRLCSKQTRKVLGHHVEMTDIISSHHYRDPVQSNWIMPGI